MLIIPLWYCLSILSESHSTNRRNRWYQDFYYAPTKKSWWTFDSTEKSGTDVLGLEDMESKIDCRNGLINSVTEIMDKYGGKFHLDPKRRYGNYLQCVKVDDRNVDLKFEWIKYSAQPNDRMWWPNIPDPNKKILQRKRYSRLYETDTGIKRVLLTCPIRNGMEAFVGAEGIVSKDNCLMWTRYVYTQRTDSQQYDAHASLWLFYTKGNPDVYTIAHPLTIHIPKEEKEEEKGLIYELLNGKHSMSEQQRLYECMLA